jgi:carboxymethylenebutenolidase
VDVRIERVDVPTQEGTADAVLAVPDDGERHPGVLVYMDAFGLRPRLEEMAGRLAAEGYAVLVPNVFYRHGRAPVAEAGNLTDPEQRSRAVATIRPMMEALTPDAVERDASAYVALFTDHERVTSGPLGTVGYCMGGALAWRTAAYAGERVAAVATFHAGRLATEAPTSPHLLAGRIRAEVYAAHADNDASMTPEQQQAVARALSDAGVSFRAELYAGAPHGFSMADTAAYDADAEQRHWEAMFALFGRTLG